MVASMAAGLGLLSPRPVSAFLDTGTLLTNAASATYMGGGQGTSVTYSATAKILVANPALFMSKDVNPTFVGTAGGLVTYLLCFSNGGANSAFNFTITDKWPNNTYWTNYAYSAWYTGGALTTGTASVSLLAGPWGALPPTGQGQPGTGYWLRWAVPMMGVGYSGCITFVLSIG